MVQVFFQRENSDFIVLQASASISWNGKKKNHLILHEEVGCVPKIFQM